MIAYITSDQTILRRFITGPKPGGWCVVGFDKPYRWEGVVAWCTSLEDAVSTIQRLTKDKDYAHLRVERRPPPYKEHMSTLFVTEVKDAHCVA